MAPRTTVTIHNRVLPFTSGFKSRGFFAIKGLKWRIQVAQGTRLQDKSVQIKFPHWLSQMPSWTKEAQRDDEFARITHITSTRVTSRIASLAIRCMRTRSQARSRNRRQQQLTTVIVEEPEFPMADNRTMAQMLQAPIEGYEDAIVVPPINANNFELKQTLINLVQNSAAGGNFLDKMPRDGLAISESKSKVRYSRSHAIEPRASTNAPLSTSTPSNSFEFQQLAASLEDKMDIRMSRLEKMISEKNVTTPATIKAVEEVCVTCWSP
ncbi:hypothetical protein Tco_0565361 [Tanacetum coccineum]